MSAGRRAIDELLAIMARLRDPSRGCPWDREQTFATIAPYTLEEAYEVADAIARDDPAAIRDELGDLLFQVVFHARMAEERGWFDFYAVAAGIRDKLVRRHPHVFGDARVASAAEQTRSWEALKARERGDAGTLAGVPLALPALTRAAKLGRRAARVGFDWPGPREVREKVAEELAELDAAVAAGPGGVSGEASEGVTEELGDLLFAIVNWSRHLGVDPEAALRAANAKFERRFARMEALARERGLSLESLSAAEWDALWNEAKVDGHS